MEQPSVETQLALINAKLDLLLVTRDDFEIRLRRLEQFRWLLVGLALLAGPMSTLIIRNFLVTT